jgi:hypothetical protein
MLKTNVYRGDGSGGPVDYAAPVAVVSVASYAIDDMAPGESRRYGIRIVDDATGLEESGTAAQILLTRAADGTDASAPPVGPTAIRFLMQKAGLGVVSWSYLKSPIRPDPAEFRVFAGEGDAVDWDADPAAVLDATPIQSSYNVFLSIFTDDLIYSVGVRGFDARGVSDGNTLSKTFRAAVLPPRDVESLSGMPTFRDA